MPEIAVFSTERDDDGDIAGLCANVLKLIARSDATILRLAHRSEDHCRDVVVQILARLPERYA